MSKTSFIALGLAVCTAALAQQAAAKPESVKGVVRKNLAPVSDEVLTVKFPRPVERTLRNGLKALIVENHRVPMVRLELNLPASTLHDPPGLPGVASATAQMIRQGTSTRTSRQIADEVSELGATLNVNAIWGSSGTRLSAAALRENFDALLALASDVLLNATFPQDEFDKWKKRTLSMLQQARSRPNFLGEERMGQVLYPNDPRGLIAPTIDSVNKMTRQDLLEFRKRYYAPSGSLLGVSGDITPDEAVAKLEKAFAAWEGGGVAPPNPARQPAIPDKKIYLVNRPDSVQTYLVLANHAIDRLSPDFVSCTVLNQILGDGPASRLFVNIREEKGFTYGVYSSFRAGKFLDQFSASSSVRTPVTGAALDEFLKEFRKIREEAVPKDELADAKRAIVGAFVLSLESQSEALNRMLTLREFGLPDDYWDTYPQKIMAVTAEDVLRVARKYIPLDNLQLVAVGEAGQIRDVLKKYGPVEEYDIEGKKTN